jgi:type I restriction enzyme S subunit
MNVSKQIFSAMTAAATTHTIPSGYKQTEVGIIPEDWEVKRLGDVLCMPPSYGVNAPAVPLNHRLPTYIRITDITVDGRYAKSSEVSVNCRDADRYMLRTGDLVFARTGASVGKSYLYRRKDGDLVYAGFLIRISPTPDRLASDYLAFFVQSATYWNWISTNCARSGQPGINGQEYASLPIPLPPRPEQVAIAGALSDADGWIESLEKLIAKKRAIKQGTMQALLTPPGQPGHQRLPGFEGKWEVKRLGEIARLYQPETISAASFKQSGYPVYGANGIVGYFDRFNHEKWQVTVTCRGSTCGTVNRAIAPCWITGNAMVICCDETNSIDKSFLYYLLLSSDLSGCISGTGQPQIVRTPLANFCVSLPPLPEQTAIAAVLSDMDAELEALEAKLSKARQIKQGMMQELLTGRVRLV